MAPAKKAPAKPAFGGYAVCFKGVTDSLESIMGKAPLAPAAMTKKLWEYIKANRLSSK